MKTYFSNVQTLDELRKQYRDLLKKYHPDNGGSEEETKAINIEYERLFKILKDKHTRQQDTTDSNTDNNKSSFDNMRYNFEEDELLRDVDYAKSERQFRVNGAAVPFPTAHQRRSLFIDFITLAHAYSVHSFQDGKNAFCQ